jgi:spermidine/putrescine transport system permease protein
MVLRQEPLNILFSYPAIVVGLVHAYLPYAILTCYISLQSIDDALIEAARSLGANRMQAFFRVLLPLSLPGIFAAVFLIFVPVIGSFMEPRILGGKDAIMLGPIIEGQFITAFNWPLGAALSFTMLAIVLLILLATLPVLRMQGARA